MTIAEPSVKSPLLDIRFNGQALGTGTGFIGNAPRGPVLITNRHNVTGRHQDTGQPFSPTGGVPNEVVIMHDRTNLLGQWVPRIEPLYNNSGQSRWIEHPEFGARADFVALPLTQLLLIRLFQQATRYSVGGWPGRPFPRTCASFNVSSRPRKPAKRIWRPVAGRMVSSVRGVDTGEPMRW